jgi:hypothetical protein
MPPRTFLTLIAEYVPRNNANGAESRSEPKASIVVGPSRRMISAEMSKRAAYEVPRSR